jgi:apolipoprotein N-acyltransferase
MQARSLEGEAFRFGVTICYEDVVANVFRRFVTSPDGSKRVEFMLNISNDGWFGRGTQQPQHLVSCAFRAIENRIGIARAVNTGVSGFLDSDGSWHDLMVGEGKGPRAGGTGYRVARVQIDRRVTFYSRYGDVFAWACAALTVLAMVSASVTGVRGWRAGRLAGKEKGTV